MPSFWQQMPFVRILIAYAIGILLAYYEQINLASSFIIGGLAVITLFYNYQYNKKINTPISTGIGFFILFICLGNFGLNQQKSALEIKHFSKNSYQAVLVQTIQKPIATKAGWKAEAKVIGLYNKQLKPIEGGGKILLFGKNSEILPGAYGNQFLIKSGIYEIVANNNPGSFNFKEYMNRKGIFHQCFLNDKKAILVQTNQGNKILQSVFYFQDYIHQSLQKHLLGKNEIAIAEALLYGYDKDIDDEISDAYSKTGTLHVLAVSGMHVGLIFMLLSWILSPLLKLPSGKYWLALFQIIGIWVYAVLCGLSPSILRACVMFSFVIVGKQISKSSNPFNSLSAAGFLLLCLNPYMIFNVGFQLSFAAVAGILGFYPYLNLLVHFKHNFINEVWKILAISLAAQTLTLPISIFYFHQFPNYFLIANLIIIPLSTFIIYGGIILLICAPIPLLGTWIGFVLSKLISLTAGITVFIAQLPYSAINNIIWSPAFIVSYYLIGIALIHYFSERNIGALKFILSIYLALLLFGLNQTHQQLHTHKLCIYASKQSLVLQVHQAAQLQIWKRGHDSLELEKKLVQPYTLSHPISSQIWQNIDTNNYVLNLGNNKKLLLLQQSAVPQNSPFDILLISGKKQQNLEKIVQLTHAQKVVLHTDIPLYRKEQYKEILVKNKIPFHDITENGAFELSL